MNVLHLIALAGMLLPLLKAWGWLVLGAFLVLRQQTVRKHLPAAVSRWLNDPTVLSVVKEIAQREDLDSDAKRATAAARIAAYLHGRGIELPDHLIDLILALIVARLHKEGAL